MADETQAGSGDAGDSRDGGGGSAGEPTPLQTRAPFLANWHWQSVVRRKNLETHARFEAEWQEGRANDRTLLETLDWLRSFHRKAPFLFNDNSVAEIARTLTDALFAEFPRARRRDLAAHYVAGVLNRESLSGGICALAELAEFKPGDRVKTLKGSSQGVVKRILPDGRIAWRPDGASGELLALPEGLLRLK